MIRIILITTCFFLALVQISFSEEIKTPIYDGMTFNEVLKARGAPNAKDIHETSRVIIWEYKNENLVFRDGKLTQSNKKIAVIPDSKTQVALVKRQEPSKTSPAISQKVVDEIMDAIPNDSGASTASATSESSAPAPGQPVPFTDEEE